MSQVFVVCCCELKHQRWLSVFCRGSNHLNSQLTWTWASLSVAVNRSLDLQFTFWSTEDEAAVSENGAKSVSELSEAESSHCDDEAPPGTPACIRPLTPSFSTSAFVCRLSLNLSFFSSNVSFVSEKKSDTSWFCWFRFHLTVLNSNPPWFFNFSFPSLCANISFKPAWYSLVR